MYHLVNRSPSRRATKGVHKGAGLSGDVAAPTSDALTCGLLEAELNWCFQD